MATFKAGDHWLALLTVALYLLIVPVSVVESQQFCSFFGNKSPTPQPGLQNCTWYRNNSCCVNEEISSLFSSIQVPDNANKRCRNFITYLMCYVCDPAQSGYYAQERLTVCSDFCDDLLSACTDAVLKGDRLGTRYGSNGTAYCYDRRFQVGTQGREACFTLASSNRILPDSGSKMLKPNTILLCLMAFAASFFSPRSKALMFASGFLLFLLLSGFSHGLVTDADIKSLSSAVGSSLSSVAGSAIQRDRLQELYDTANSSVRELNATMIVENIGHQLRLLTDDLETATTALANAIQTLRRQAGPAPSTLLARNLTDLPSAIYVDADSVSQIENLATFYNSTYLRPVSFRQSAIKIPDSVNRSLPEVYDTIQWTAQLDRVFSTLQSRHNVRWTYFGSESGVYRIYPASEWESNFAGFKVDYDPRSRPWYLAATSGPETVGIFLDCSASMAENNRWDIAVAAVTAIINALSREDHVNIICAKGDYVDTRGFRRRTSPVVLGCNKTALMRATESNKAHLLEAVRGQSPFGSGAEHVDATIKLLDMFPAASQGCQNILVFITDGKDTDKQHFKDRCSTDHGSRGCNLIRLDLNRVLNEVAARAESSHRTMLNVVGIETGNQGSELPGKLACNNNGLYLQLLSASGVRSQMTPYFSYLSRLIVSNSERTKPTAPYVDASGLGRIITLSRVIYDPNDSSKLLGVVGVDAVIDDLENTLLDDDLGLSYAFLMDLEGRALIHPRLRPSAELVGTPVYPHIETLEMRNNQPAEFRNVLSQMLMQNSGSSAPIIGPRSRPRGSLGNGVVWVENVNFTYHYAAVPNTDYAYAFVLTQGDVNQAYLSPLPYRSGQPVSYYHEIDTYDAATRATIGYDNQNLLYPNIPIAALQSTFKLASRALCDPTAYLLSDVPNASVVHQYFNSDSQLMSCMSGGQFPTDIRHTVWTSQPIQDLWRNASSTLSSTVAWTYFGSANGVYRIFPGTRSPKTYDPTRRPWYHRTISNPPSVYASSAVYLDATGIGKVVSLGQTIFQSKSVSTPGDCVGSRRAGNCPCSSHSDCESMYCYGSSCSNPEVAGVAGTDMRYNRFSFLVESALASIFVDHADRCTTPGNRCILVNDGAEVVYDQTFAGISDVDRQRYENVPLASLYGSIMLDLLDHEVFERSGFVNHQGICQVSSSASSTANQFQALSPAEQDNFFQTRGPIPKFQNDFGCEKDQVLYHLNRDSQVFELSSFVRSFFGPCEKGLYRLYPVNNTNLLLLVIQTTNDTTSNFFNFNCRIFNNVAISGGFERKEGACDGSLLDSQVQQTCPMSSNYVPECSFNTAANLVQPLVLPLSCSLLLSFWLQL